MTILGLLSTDEGADTVFEPERLRPDPGTAAEGDRRRSFSECVGNAVESRPNSLHSQHTGRTSLGEQPDGVLVVPRLAASARTT